MFSAFLNSLNLFFFLIYGGCKYDSTTGKYVAYMLLDLKCCLLAFISRLRATQPVLFKNRNVRVGGKIVYRTKKREGRCFSPALAN